MSLDIDESANVVQDTINFCKKEKSTDSLISTMEAVTGALLAVAAVSITAYAIYRDVSSVREER